MILRTLAFAFIFVLPRSLFAAESKDAPYDESALKSALEEAPGARKKNEKAGSALEVPPPPLRKTGVVLEGKFRCDGLFRQAQHDLADRLVFPPAARNRTLPLAHGVRRRGTSRSRARVTRRRPAGYSMYAFGGGARLTVGLTERVSAYAQVDFGLMTTSTNVLHSYGFYDAENMNGYFGGTADSSGTRPTRTMLLPSMAAFAIAGFPPRSIGRRRARVARFARHPLHLLRSMRLGLGAGG